MPSLTLTCNKSAKIVYTSPSTNYSSDQYASGLSVGTLLMGFPSASSIGHKAVTGMSFGAFVIPRYDQSRDIITPAYLKCFAIRGAWTENSVTWNTRPTIDSYPTVFETGWSNVAAGMTVTSGESITDIALIKTILQYGLAAEVEAMGGAAYDANLAQVGTRRAPSGRIPYIAIQYSSEDVKGGISGMSPTSGNYPKTQATKFQWSVGTTGSSLVSVYVTNIKFRWRPLGTEAYTEIDCGTDLSYTVPANTFTTDQIQWQLETTDNFGAVSTTSWKTITTNDVLYTCEIVSPRNEIVYDTDGILVKFRVNNSTGQTPQSIRLDFWRTDNETWWGWTFAGTLWDDWSVSGVERTRKLNSSLMPTGEVRLRLYANNSDGTAGPYAYSTFTRIAAPNPPSVSVNAVPQAVISWQADNQLAYRVTIDGTVYGPYFGSKNSFVSPELLDDGEHTASVEAQGQYGLWSAPGTYTFTVTNVPPSVTLDLDASFDMDAVLSMTKSWPELPYFFVYRDGVKIAETTDLQYVDRLSLGEHSYQVKAVFASRNYIASNIVTGVTMCESMAIAPAAGGDWLMLRTSASSDRADNYSYSKTHSLRHFLGATYPLLETSSFADLSGSYETAFMDKQKADQFWNLRGEVVILKSRGEVLVGILANVRKTVSNFLYAFSFELQRIDWEGLSDDPTA